MQSALQDRGGSQAGVHLKDEWERKREAGGMDGEKSANICLRITAVNCEHRRALRRSLRQSDGSYFTPENAHTLLLLLLLPLPSQLHTVCVAIHMRSLKIYMHAHVCRKPGVEEEEEMGGGSCLA